jgi:hypothetical protein
VSRVPPPDQTEQDRQIALERRLAKVRIDARGARPELLEALEAELERDRQSAADHTQ